MIPRLIGMAAGVLAVLAICGPALAFSGDSDGGDPRADSPAPSQRGDYRYSGNGFNFSMSRNPSQPNDDTSARDQGGPQPPASRSRPNLFQRMIRTLLDGD